MSAHAHPVSGSFPPLKHKFLNFFLSSEKCRRKTEQNLGLLCMQFVRMQRGYVCVRMLERVNSILISIIRISVRLVHLDIPHLVRTQGEIGGDITFKGSLRDLIRSNRNTPLRHHARDRPTSPPKKVRRVIVHHHHHHHHHRRGILTNPPTPLAVGYLEYIPRDTLLSTVKKYTLTVPSILFRVKYSIRSFDTLSSKSEHRRGNSFAIFHLEFESIQVNPNSVDYIQPAAVTRETGT